MTKFSNMIGYDISSPIKAPIGQFSEFLRHACDWTVKWDN